MPQADKSNNDDFSIYKWLQNSSKVKSAMTLYVTEFWKITHMGALDT